MGSCEARPAQSHAAHWRGESHTAQVFGFIALILHTVFATHEHVSAPGLPPGEHINGALAGYGLSGVILLLFVTAFDFAIQHFGWRKYIAFWWIGALFGFFLLLLTTGALGTPILCRLSCGALPLSVPL